MIKEEFSWQPEKKMVIYKKISSIGSSDFSEETLQTEEWYDIVKILKEKNHQPRIIYIQQSYPSDRKEKYRLSQKKKKAEGIYHHKICNIRNVERAFLP